MSTNPDVLRSLWQQVESDRLLGARAIPAALVVPDVPVQAAGRSSSGGAAAPKAAGDRAERLRVLNVSQVKSCTRCSLATTRTQTVFGQGDPAARLVFVGEAPGFEEDRKGVAFVGKAGQLLTKMIEAMGLTRDDVFICNVLKCRPPNNRDPLAEEILACQPFLLEQLQIIQPEVLVALGAPAAKTLLCTAQSIGRLRGQFHDYYLSGTPGVGVAVPVMPTYHPAYLLRSPGEKRKAWEDLQQVMERLGLPRPAPGGR